LLHPFLLNSLSKSQHKSRPFPQHQALSVFLLDPPSTRNGNIGVFLAPQYVNLAFQTMQTLDDLDLEPHVLPTFIFYSTVKSQTWVAGIMHPVYGRSAGVGEMKVNE
jgi:hypothetical protein